MKVARRSIAPLALLLFVGCSSGSGLDAGFALNTGGASQAVVDGYLGLLMGARF